MVGELPQKSGELSVKSFFCSSFYPRLLELEHELIVANSELCMQYRIKACTETCT